MDERLISDGFSIESKAKTLNFLKTFVFENYRIVYAGKLYSNNVIEVFDRTLIFNMNVTENIKLSKYTLATKKRMIQTINKLKKDIYFQDYREKSEIKLENLFAM